MRLWSNSWTNGDTIPARYAAGRLEGVHAGAHAGAQGVGGVTFGDNVNPHLAWAEVPAGARSLVLICHDFDVPSKGDDVNQPGREVPADLHRVDFFHWVLADVPTTVSSIAEGEFSSSFTARGKPGPQALHGTRQGLNDYTGWFAANAEMAGAYFGYDGPFPPFNDSLVHHYVFTLYALSVDRLDVEGHFTGIQARAALAGLVLASATFSGTYTLNRRLLAL